MKLPQLSLRELFLLVALVAMGLGWWIDRQRLDATNRELNANLKELSQAMESHGFTIQVDPNSGKTFWNSGRGFMVD